MRGRRVLTAAGLMLAVISAMAPATTAEESLLHNPGISVPGGWLLGDGIVDAERQRDHTHYHGIITGTHDAMEEYDRQKPPSWSYTITGGGDASPRNAVMSYRLRYHGAPGPCELREHGLVLHRWGDGPLHEASWRSRPDGTPRRLGDFPVVRVKARVRLDAYAPTRYDPASACAEWRAAYVTIDLRVYYPGKRSDILGLHIWEMPDSWTGYPVIWADGCRDGCPVGHLAGGPGWSQQLSGNGIVLQLRLGEWTTYDLDMKDLLMRYSPPPPGWSLDDAQIIGVDIYTHVRGVSIDFSVTDLDVVGVAAPAPPAPAPAPPASSTRPYKKPYWAW